MFLQTFQACSCVLLGRAWRDKFQEFASCQDKTLTFLENMHAKSTPSKSSEKPMVLQGFCKSSKTLEFSLLFEGVHFVCMFFFKVLVLFRQNANSWNSSRLARAKRTQGHASNVCRNLQCSMVFAHVWSVSVRPLGTCLAGWISRIRILSKQNRHF